jgi:hypothetical protein
MKKIMAVIAGLTMAVSVQAGMLTREMFFADYSGTNGAFRTVITNETISGYIESIEIDAPAAGVTGTVSVVMQPELSTMSPINLMSSATVSGDTIIRPRTFGTDAGGNIPSTNTVIRFPVCGDKIICTVTNIGSVSTGIIWKFVIKYEGR